MRRGVAISLCVVVGVGMVACRGERGQGDAAGGDAAGGDAGAPRGPDGGRVVIAGDAAAGRQINGLHAAEQHRQLDLLFMIDNSSSMLEEQANLARNFTALVRALEALPGGLPDLHIGIVSSDLGAGPIPRERCRPFGDAGKFLVKPGCGLEPGQGAFLAVDGAGKRNFTGELATVFACLGAVGTAGCDYEHPLQAVRAALADLHPENRGFLRPGALLAIVLLTDEDDCSAEPDATVFDEMRPGEATSFRCNALGHLCNDRSVPGEPFSAPLRDCKPYTRSDSERSSRLINVGDFVAFIKGLKPGRPEQIVVSAITGWDDRPEAQYRTGRRAGGLLEIMPICASSVGEAAPALRLKALVDAFGANGTLHSICAADLAPALRGIGESLLFKLAGTCLAAPVRDDDPARDGMQAECHVVQNVPRADGGLASQPIPACGTGQRPCWELLPDGSCAGGHRLNIARATAPPPGALVASSCRGADSPPRSCGSQPCPVPPVLAGLGEMCELDMPGLSPLPRNQALWRGDDHVCKSGLCVRPATDPVLAQDVKTSALCTTTCTTDSDCAGAAMRNPANIIDKRCARGFTCAVAFETGPLRCERLCLCRDFLSAPADLPAPASCTP